MSTMDLEDALNMRVRASGAVRAVAGGRSLPYLWLRFFSPETPGGAAAPLLVFSGCPSPQERGHSAPDAVWRGL